MKIALCQIKSDLGNIGSNIKHHRECILNAISKGAQAIFFPELSITGYITDSASEYKLSLDDERLNVFQELADVHNVTLGIGAPLEGRKGVYISMFIFQKNKARRSYEKQFLYIEEKDYYIEGSTPCVISLEEFNLAPAICYESKKEAHLHKALGLNVQVYLASNAMDAPSIKKATPIYSSIAKKNKLPILMVNSVGVSSGFVSAGNSMTFNTQGKITQRLSVEKEEILIVDLKSLS